MTPIQRSQLKHHQHERECDGKLFYNCPPSAISHIHFQLYEKLKPCSLFKCPPVSAECLQVGQDLALHHPGLPHLEQLNDDGEGDVG